MQHTVVSMKAAAGLLCWAVVCGTVAGCGGDLYEQRLENSKKLFAHMEQLDSNLDKPWTDPQSGVSLRVPLGFVMIPPPATAQTAAENPAQPQEGQPGEEKPPEAGEVVDERQPKYMNVELPGLRGAFTAPIKVFADNVQADGFGFIYVMSNHHLAEKAESAKTFGFDVARMIAEAVHVSLEQTAWQDAQFPMRRDVFASPVAYKYVLLSPDEPVNGVSTQFGIYLHDRGDVQVVVVFVLPNGSDPALKFGERIPLCLETLSVGARQPGGGTGAVGGGGSPSGSSL